jgi:hypothetical protein
MIISSDMTVTIWIWCANFAQDDYSCWATIDTECATGAHIIVNDEKNVVRRV